MISIGTWNLNHWSNTAQQSERIWRLLEEKPFADIMLLQECLPPEDTESDRLVFSKLEGRGEWGTAVFSKNHPISEIKVRQTHPGTLALGSIDFGDDVSITAISVYGMLEREDYPDEWASTTMHRIVSDITPLIHYGRKNTMFAVGGDYNISTQWDDGRWPSHKLVFDRLEDLGLVNATLEKHGKHLPTFSWDNPIKQNDYIHLSGTRVKIIDCDIIRSEDLKGMSDHIPLIASIEI